MIIKKILTFLFFNILVLGYSQKRTSYMECKYDMKFVSDTTNASNTTIEERISLLIGENVSLFKSDIKKKADSIARILLSNNTENSEGKFYIDWSSLPKFNYFREVYRENSKTFIYSKILNNIYRFEPLYKIDWLIVPETKEIDGYLCKKAIGKYGNKKIIAWFTETVPIPEGPYVFKGLPGLIINVYDENKYFIFTMVSLKKINLPIEAINNYIDTEYDKYMKKRSDLHNDPSGNYFQAIGRQMTKEREKEFLNGYKKVNNYLD